MKSVQDVDVVSLADKGIVVRCFVCRNYDKVLMETGQFCDNIRVTKNWLVSGVDRMFKSSDSAFKHITDRLNPLRKSVDIFFLRPPSGVRFACIHDIVEVLVPWKWDRFPIFRSLAYKISLFVISYDIEITWHYIATWSIKKLRARAGTR